MLTNAQQELIDQFSYGDFELAHELERYARRIYSDAWYESAFAERERNERDAKKALDKAKAEALEDGRAKGFLVGYKFGWDAGWKSCNKDQGDKYYQQGLDEGYVKGHKIGLDEGLLMGDYPRLGDELVKAL